MSKDSDVCLKTNITTNSLEQISRLASELHKSGNAQVEKAKQKLTTSTYIYVYLFQQHGVLVMC